MNADRKKRQGTDDLFYTTVDKMLRYGIRMRMVAAAVVLGAMTLAAQPPGGGPGPGGPRPGGPMGGQGRGPMGAVPQGRWWTDPAMVRRLALTPEQQKQIETLFQGSRVKLIDLDASVQKEDAMLEPLLEGEHPDEAKVLAQIDRVAQARAELEKARARMLLGFRGVLNQEQWKTLQATGREGPPPQRNNPPPPRNNGR